VSGIGALEVTRTSPFMEVVRPPADMVPPALMEPCPIDPDIDPWVCMEPGFVEPGFVEPGFIEPD